MTRTTPQSRSQRTTPQSPSKRPRYPWATKRAYPARGEPTEAQAEQLAKRVRQSFFDALGGELILQDVTRLANVAEREALLYWLDQGGNFHHARLQSYMEPDLRDPARPLIMRVSINYYSVNDIPGLIRRAGWASLQAMLEGTRRERGWKGRYTRFELSLLPNQVVAFAPWVASFIRANEGQDDSLVTKPPDSLHFCEENILHCVYAWSTQAYNRILEYYRVSPPELRDHVCDGTIWQMPWRALYARFSANCNRVGVIPNEPRLVGGG